jgi:hypothetical protein
LVGNYPVVHCAAHNTENLSIKEEGWSKARRLERHREKMAIKPAVWLVTVRFQIGSQNWPKSVSARIDQASRKM